MARRDNDIFKKLGKSVPAAKEIKPLSEKDFVRRKETAAPPAGDKPQAEKEIEIPPVKPPAKPAPPKRTMTLPDEPPAKPAPPKRTMTLPDEPPAKPAPPKKTMTLPDEPVAQPPKKTAPPARKLVLPDEAPKAEEKPAPAAAEDKPAAKKEKPHPPKPARKPERLARPTDEVKDEGLLDYHVPRRKQERIRERDAELTRRPVSKPSLLHKMSSQTEGRNADEGLDFRHELKFYINYRDYAILRGALGALMSLDAYAGEDNMYHIRSLYFDDMYDTAAREKIAGIDDRCKYRIRIYNYSDETIKFEKKIKQGQYIAKKSILLSHDEYDRIVGGDYGFLMSRPESLAKEIYMKLTADRLAPRVLVDYYREAYVHPIENVRVTFDKQLKGSLRVSDIFDTRTPSMPMFDKGMMVLEVKFNRFLPDGIQRALYRLNAAQRSAISKYLICRKYD